MRCAFTRTTPTLIACQQRTERSAGREPRRYEIRVSGPIGSTMMRAFPTLAASQRGQDTLVTGSLLDQCALYGVIGQLEALGLQLLELGCPKSGGGRTVSEIT